MARHAFAARIDAVMGAAIDRLIAERVTAALAVPAEDDAGPEERAPVGVEGALHHGGPAEVGLPSGAEGGFGPDSGSEPAAAEAGMAAAAEAAAPVAAAAEAAVAAPAETAAETAAAAPLEAAAEAGMAAAAEAAAPVAAAEAAVAAPAETALEAAAPVAAAPVERAVEAAAPVERAVEAGGEAAAPVEPVASPAGIAAWSAPIVEIAPASPAGMRAVPIVEIAPATAASAAAPVVDITPAAATGAGVAPIVEIAPAMAVGAAAAPVVEITPGPSVEFEIAPLAPPVGASTPIVEIAPAAASAEASTPIVEIAPAAAPVATSAPVAAPAAGLEPGAPVADSSELPALEPAPALLAREPVSGSPALLAAPELPALEPASASPPSTAAFALPGVESAAELLDLEAASQQSFDETPSWREPTQIMSGGPERPPAPVPAELVDVRREALAPDAPLAAGSYAPPPGTSELAPPAATAETGTLVSELRRTMSEIEHRLFGEADTVGSVPDEEAPPELDLLAIGLETIPGVPSLGGAADVPAAEADFDLTDAESDSAAAAMPPSVAPAAPTARGDLRELDVASLFGRLSREKFHGDVTFRRGEAQKTVHFDGGRPIFASSNLAHDRMGDLLYREGKITREQYEASCTLVRESGRRMGEVLVELGFLKRRELLPAVRRHIEDIVYSLFAWDGGEYVAVAGTTADDEKIRLATHPAAIVVEGIRRKHGFDRLRASLGGPATVIVPTALPATAAILSEAELSPDDRRVLELFDGHRSLAEVTSASGLDEVSVYALGYALFALGLARVDDRTVAADASSATAGSPTSSLASPADLKIDRDRILAKHAHVEEADYFTVLGLRRDATSFEVHRAYQLARRDFAPEAFPPELRRELGAALADIVTVVDEAYRVLHDDRSRSRYLANLPIERG